MKTFFRAYQLDSEGSLFSFYKKNTFTLIEARLPKAGIEVIAADLKRVGKTAIDVLHITSWDVDHCNYNDLTKLLNRFRPALIEVPDYNPTTEEGKLCQRVILRYDIIHEDYIPNVRVISKAYLDKLTEGTSLGTKNIVYESMFNCDNKNNMSLIKLFRSSGFNVLSLGDCESAEIAENLLSSIFICKEVDVLILPHHGADNGFITEKLLNIIKPKVAICAANFDNKFEHPKEEICKLLAKCNIQLCTTKRGDVLIGQQDDSEVAVVLSMFKDNSEVEKKIQFKPKRFAGTAAAV